MCRITSDGYLMADGTLVPFVGLDINALNPDHIMELRKVPATAWDLLLIRNSSHDIKNDVLAIMGKLDKIGKSLDAHTKSCPINTTEVKKIVNDTLNEMPRRTLKKWGEYALWITSIINLIILIIVIIKN